MKVDVIPTQYAASALKTLAIELEALETLRMALRGPQLGQAMDAATVAIVATRGRVIVTGMGKSGHIACKIAATMRSTGTLAMYLHPGEASHGDLGLITAEDIVLAITWSGETAELGDILRYCRNHRIPLIVATARADSTAGRAADICLAMPQVREACPNALAPTSSTTLQLVLGDALAVALIEARGFTPDDFHVFHPGGRAGAQLTTVAQVMGTGVTVPRVAADASLISATIEMSAKRYGCTAVVDTDDSLVGVFTDGDLRRCVAVCNPVRDIDQRIDSHMSRNPVTVAPATRVTEALRILTENAVSVLFVVENGKLMGIVHIHDIVRIGIG